MISVSTRPKKGVYLVSLSDDRYRSMRCARVPRVALYCGLSRFRNFALWCRFSRGGEQGRLGGRHWTAREGWIEKGGAEVPPDSEYDHSLRPPRPKIAHTLPVFTQRHRLATCRFMDRSETDEKCEKEIESVYERKREKEKRRKDGRWNERTDREKQREERERGQEKDKFRELRRGQESYRGE